MGGARGDPGAYPIARRGRLGLAGTEHAAIVNAPTPGFPVIMTSISDFQDHSSERKVHERALERADADTQAHLKKVLDREALQKLSAAAELAQR